MPDLTVNLGDLRELRDALPRFRDRAEAIRGEIHAAREEQSRWAERAALKEREYEAWMATVQALEAQAALLSGEPLQVSPRFTHGRHRPDDADPDENAVDQVVHALEHLGGAATPAQLRERVPGLAPKTVGWALWKAEQTNRVRKLSKGVYAPLSYLPVELPVALEFDPSAGSSP
jgi:hypothetical protein